MLYNKDLLGIKNVYSLRHYVGTQWVIKSAILLNNNNFTLFFGTIIRNHLPAHRYY
jgi:hypothetical protein